MNWHDPSPWIAIASSAAVVLGLLTVLWRIIRGMVRAFRKFGHLMDDLQGEAARPGQAARPGILEIQAEQTKQLADQTEQLKAIQHEFKPNGGETIRDAINRVERKTEAAARLASDSAEETRRVVQQHVWHVSKFHGGGEERRHTESPEEPHA
jgi:hypothetical protein